MGSPVSGADCDVAAHRACRDGAMGVGFHWKISRACVALTLSAMDRDSSKCYDQMVTSINIKCAVYF